MLTKHNIRNYLKNVCGGKIEVMAEKITEQLDCSEDHRDKNGKFDHLEATEDFSLREIAEGLGAEVNSSEVIMEGVTASQFSILVGTLLSSVVMRAYEAAAKVGNQLVTPFNSRLEIDTIPGAYLETSQNLQIKEGGDAAIQKNKKRIKKKE